MTFECSKCGKCCKNIRGIIGLEEYIGADGRCKYLQTDNTCSMYSNRPDICNVEKYYKEKYKGKFSKKEFYELNKVACDKLRNIYQEKERCK